MHNIWGEILTRPGDILDGFQLVCRDLVSTSVSDVSICGVKTAIDSWALLRCGKSSLELGHPQLAMRTRLSCMFPDCIEQIQTKLKQAWSNSNTNRQVAKRHRKPSLQTQWGSNLRPHQANPWKKIRLRTPGGTLTAEMKTLIPLLWMHDNRSESDTHWNVRKPKGTASIECYHLLASQKQWRTHRQNDRTQRVVWGVSIKVKHTFSKELITFFVHLLHQDKKAFWNLWPCTAKWTKRHNCQKQFRQPGTRQKVVRFTCVCRDQNPVFAMRATETQRFWSTTSSESFLLICFWVFGGTAPFIWCQTLLQW